MGCGAAVLPVVAEVEHELELVAGFDLARDFEHCARPLIQALRQPIGAVQAFRKKGFFLAAE